jgi:hypothetical protein
MKLNYDKILNQYNGQPYGDVNGAMTLGLAIMTTCQMQPSINLCASRSSRK